MEGFRIQPLPRILAVTGMTGPADEDAFAGVAIAVGWWPVGPESVPPDPLYLVSDESRSSPIWVSSSELSENTVTPPLNS